MDNCIRLKKAAVKSTPVWFLIYCIISYFYDAIWSAEIKLLLYEYL